MSSPRTLLLAMAGSILLFSRTTASDSRLDSFDDRLPPYAVARLGSPRLRHGQPISGLIFSPDGKALLSVGWGETSLSTVRLWDAADGKEKWSLIQRFASCAAFAPDGRIVAVGGSNGVVRLWATETGRELHKLAGDPGAVSAVAFTRGAVGVVTAGGSGKLHLWDVLNGLEVRAFIGHVGEVLRLALSADGRTLASTGADGTLRVWEVETGKESLKIVLPRATDALAMSPDGKTLYAPGVDGKVRRWATSGKELPSLNAGDKPVQRLAISADGQTLATAADGSIRIWDVKTDKALARITRPTGDVTALAISPDGKTVAAAGANGAVRLWDAAGKERLAAQGHTKAVTAVSYSQRGRVAVTESEDGTVRSWDAATGRELSCGPKVEAPKYSFLDNSRKKLVCLALAPDGRTLASASEGDAVRLWDVEKGRELNRFNFVEATALALGVKGRVLAIGRTDGLVYIVDAATGKTIHVLSGHSGSVSALAFSPDGRLQASGGADHLLRVWEAATGTELLTLAGHSGAVRAAAFSPDGRTLLSGGAEGVGLTWDLTRGPGGRAARKQPLTSADLVRRWADLLSEDGPTANGALWELAAAPEQSVPFIHDQMRPLFGGDARRAAKLIVDLDDDSFDVRERASAGLAAMGPTIAPLLKHARAGTQSSEVSHRLAELLSRLKETVPWQRERLRVLRALTALEKSGAPAARELLEATAKAAVEPEVKQAAREALERLAASQQ